VNKRERWLAAGKHYKDETAASVEGEVCFYCGDPAKTWDHIIARANGGSDDPTNLVPVCTPCNSSKSAKTLDEWFDHLTKYREQAERQVERMGRQLAGLARLRGSHFRESGILYVRFIEPRAMADFRDKIAANPGDAQVVLLVGRESVKLGGRYDRDFLLMLARSNPTLLTVTAA
jgi:hypothetical protein